jgi:hypothetical protein
MATNKNSHVEATRYEKLSIFEIIKEVRLPIASSIHEITRIIGSELASQVMFHVVDAFLKD